MERALPRNAGHCGRWWGAVARRVTTCLAALALGAPAAGAQSWVRQTVDRFTAVSTRADSVRVRALLDGAAARDSFPDLARPRALVLIMVAPDDSTFRAWVGPGVPEWGAAIAIPSQSRIVMHRAGSSTRDTPPVILRHELAHLALHEALGDLPPRWFDEGYASVAAGEWDRDAFVATNAALIARRIPGYDGLDSAFMTRSTLGAQAAYALAHRAVVELAALDPAHGLSILLREWRVTRRLDPAVRRAYGMTLDAAESRFQSRTRWRVAFLAVGVDSTIGLLVLLVPLVPLYRRRRRGSDSRARLCPACRRGGGLVAAAGA
jgi:hypothetical protein